MRRALRLRQIGPARLLTWVPLLAATIGLVILLALHLAAPPYLGILVFVVVYSGLTLFGPLPARYVLLAHAARVYAVTLLLAWIAALYLLPGHPATAMVSLAALLHLTSIYVFLFLQLPPLAATRWAAGTLAALVAAVLPHAWHTLGQTGVFDGVTLPVTLLVSHGTLITVLRSFSTLRDQLAQAEGRAQALHALAHRDPLTGRPNRRALEQDLARAVTQPELDWRLAVVDVDGLKGVNDSLGHAAGDDLLRRFATGFAEQAGGHGQVYRISGDEFALLLGGGQVQAETVVAQVTRAVQAVYPAAQASVGATRWRAGESPDAWLSRADQAMYRHKRRAAADDQDSSARR